MLSNINEKIFVLGCAGLCIALKPVGKQCKITESSKAIVCFSKGGKYEVTLGCQLSLNFSFNSSTSNSYSQLSKNIFGGKPTVKK